MYTDRIFFHERNGDAEAEPKAVSQLGQSRWRVYSAPLHLGLYPAHRIVHRDEFHVTVAKEDVDRINSVDIPLLVGKDGCGSNRIRAGRGIADEVFAHIRKVTMGIDPVALPRACETARQDRRAARTRKHAKWDIFDGK
jgi:hypothetical protein